MRNLQLLDEVVRDLEQDRNLTRIKKLMICVCQGSWENDAGKIEALNLRDLVLELCETTVTLHNLKYVLNGIVSKINKPQQYALVAKTIVGKVSPLYPEFQDEKTNPDISNVSEANTLITTSDYTKQQTDLQTQQDSQVEKLLNPEQIFELRHKIMQHTSPLRAKIVLFSTLKHPFRFTNEEDWLFIKRSQLDDLVQNLYAVCKSAEALETQIYNAARNLEDPEENMQTAGAIVQYMAPLYKQPETSDDREEIYTDQTYSMSHDPAAFQLQEDNQYPEINSQEFPVSNDFYQELAASAAEDIDDDNSDMLSAFSDRSAEISGIMDTEGAGKFSLRTLSQNDPSKQKQELEDKLKKMVDSTVNDVITFVESKLSQLEVSMENQLQGQDLEEMLSLKYENLGDFIIKIRDTSSQFLEILSRLEESERKRLIDESEKE